MSVLNQLGFGPKYDIVTDGDAVIVTVRPHPVLQKAEQHQVQMTTSEYENFCRWREGQGLIQHMLPGLSPDQRQLLQCGFVL